MKTVCANGAGPWCTVNWIARILLVIGGLNWGLVGLFDFDLVATLFGHMSMLSKIVYVLVGIAAVYLLVKHFLKGSES